MQIFDHTKGKSLQRDMQVAIQEPLEYYFAFNFKTEAQKPQNRTQIEYYQGDGFTYRLIPQDKNQILVRFENLADGFDKNATAVTLDVQKFANDLYEQINGERPFALKVKETWLGGINVPPPSNGRGGRLITAGKIVTSIGPQEIKSFTLTYNAGL